MQTTYKVGDKVQILDASKIKNAVSDGFKSGGIYPVTRIYNDGRPVIEHDTDFLAFFQDELKYIKLISPKPTKKQRITTLEQKVEAMQVEIDALKAAKKATVVSPTMTIKSEADIAKIAKEFTKILAKEKKQTPNEQRKAIIAEAKAFVDKYTPIVQIDDTPLTSEHGDVKITLNVNSKKRTIACNVHYLYVADAPIKRGFAKCAPDDVFNADIGKAIALGRALGLDVSKFEKAVQPSEVVSGMSVSNTCSGKNNVLSVTEVEDNKVWRTNGMYIEMKYAKITNDTKAQY